ncbi:bifunctional diguanylate cyclase/phosphodiesterase [Rhizobium sp. SSA_523]|uniref:putative bifunctional diguanylate cyclase/phosphodiesterase n=1 Tax=Rhizobium sp. SSA_523 TaxID=2952477 RepID=UPI002090D087|nr:EAL domain-containing protein [Rhizobium sp. SSA_523]MCO5732147.1 EAL domain-containing protein [Rhizobium sp. SSA_523]WKC21438.1 EAL domain-containing protein [Rhizobium sp. SSA_523]
MSDKTGASKTAAPRRIAFATALTTLVLALSIAGLLGFAILVMRDSANRMDDERALRAANAAIVSFKAKLAATVRDNAVWDDAYTAVNSEEAGSWTYDNWGKTTEAYPLYDSAVVLDRNGVVISAYEKGQVFDPYQRFGASFADMMRAANAPKRDPVLSFARAGSDILLIGSSAIQAYSSTTTDSALAVLSFSKRLSDEVVAQIATEHQLTGLSLSRNPVAPQDGLTVALPGFDGQPVAFFAWPSQKPGSAVFARIKPYILSAAGLLLAFMILILTASRKEAAILRAMAQKAHHQASHDGLTGLLNRTGLLERLAAPAGVGYAPTETLTLHLLDLDGFKAVNDAWGHAVGDVLLKMVAQRLQAVHPEAVYAARLGGDEFALLQIGRTPPDALSAEIVACLAQPFAIGGRTIEIGSSVGHCSQDPTLDPLELVRRADMALYKAKQTGRGRAYAYRPELDAEREQLASLEGQLRQAIASDLIKPVFQPLISVATQKICGVEALARWRSPTGSVAPDIFIPLAERSGLIDELGMKILASAIRSAGRWDRLTLSVNISPIQLCNPTFVDSVTALLEREAFDPRRLTLEITEGVLISNPDQARRAINALKDLGIQFALDDFGCGFASIGALRQFGFDRMKLDRSLVWGLDDEAKGPGVLKATIALAAALNIPVTAEGIETESQARALGAAGCDQLQGYLVGKPMDEEALESLIAQDRLVA